jgi:hypothetical protein
MESRIVRNRGIIDALQNNNDVHLDETVRVRTVHVQVQYEIFFMFSPTAGFANPRTVQNRGRIARRILT